MKSNDKVNYDSTQISQLEKSGKLKFDPDYQRYEVWKLKQKQDFIDSILRGFDIPKIYWRQVSFGTYEVVDGQQRLRSLLEFINKGFALSKKAEPINGIEIAGLNSEKLPMELYEKLINYDFDIIRLVGYTDEETAAYFQRLQNGTKLKYAERRRGIISKMRDMSRELAQHEFFSFCSFDNKRGNCEDFVGKLFCLIKYELKLQPTSLNVDIEWMKNKDIDYDKDPIVKRIRSVFNFIVKTLNGNQFMRDLKFKTYFALSFCLVIDELLINTNIKTYGKELSELITDLLADIDNGRRRLNSGNSCDDEIAKYVSNARRDSLVAVNYRCEVIRDRIMLNIPGITYKDPQRSFSVPQKIAIYKRDGGKCQICNKDCPYEDFWPDHKVAHANGGPTTVENGQLLCKQCNLQKGDKENLEFLSIGG